MTYVIQNDDLLHYLTLPYLTCGVIPALSRHPALRPEHESNSIIIISSSYRPFIVRLLQNVHKYITLSRHYIKQYKT